MQPSIDLSNEMLVVRHQNGIKLVRPTQAESGDNQRQSIVLGKLLDMSYNVFFHSPDSVILEANQAMLNNCGLASRAHALGSTVRSVCRNDAQAHHVLANNQRVLDTRELVIADERLDLWTNEYSHTMSFKFPWYDTNHVLIGVFGCAVMMVNNDCASISKELALITEQFITAPAAPSSLLPGKEFIGKYFSSREMDVIKYVMRGKTMREIGELLGLSRRTVESYFENIKIKANVKTRSELFDKVIAESQ